jgi:formylglycine-generating enzyme required for sulfatase activity
MGYEVRLPHEYEWEVAARFPDNRIYPYGNHFDASKSNISEANIGLTSAVGIYPHGRNPALNLYDMSGNVWEWCLNSYADLHDTGVSQARRVVRGGSWGRYQDRARASYRNRNLPDNRDFSLGFRVVRRPPSQNH